MGIGVHPGWLLGVSGVLLFSSNLLFAQPGTLPSLKGGQESNPYAAQASGSTNPTVVEAAKATRANSQTVQ